MRPALPNDGFQHRRRVAGFASDPGYSALKALVIARTGHHYYADKDDLLFDRLLKRFKARSLADAAAYAAFLAGPAGAEEWSQLEAEITIGETFFFRYAEQFTALRSVILPALIAARSSERRLRIWSAGCASGAEPYSVAILLHDLLGPSLADWDVSITGTDISVAALATARKAEYGRWALRTLPPEERMRWFAPIQAGPGEAPQGRYALRPEFRRMVRFERQNLLDLLGGGASAAFANCDLILCRNVLIYFSTQHVNGIVRAFSKRLRSDGWLLIGHAEPNPDFETWLQPVSLPGTVAYRRRDPHSPLPIVPLASAEADWQTVSTEVERFDPPPLPASTAIAIPAPSPPARAQRSRHELVPAGESKGLAQIRALADAGKSAEAWRQLGAALQTNPADPLLLHYQGLLARSLGRETEAERAFRGALFVDKDFVMAHVQLGLLHAACNRPVPARRALENALRLVRAMPSDTILPEGDGASAGDMIANLQFTLESLQDRSGTRE